MLVQVDRHQDQQQNGSFHLLRVYMLKFLLDVDFRLTDVPCVSEPMIHAEFQQLMEEADLYDAIHDCVVQVSHCQAISCL